MSYVRTKYIGPLNALIRCSKRLQQKWHDATTFSPVGDDVKLRFLQLTAHMAERSPHIFKYDMDDDRYERSLRYEVVNVELQEPSGVVRTDAQMMDATAAAIEAECMNIVIKYNHLFLDEVPFEIYYYDSHLQIYIRYIVPEKKKIS